MIKVVIYIEKDEFDLFFQWVNRLNTGTLCSPLARYSTESESFRSPLQLTIEPEMYNLIQDAERDLVTLCETVGPMEVTYEPLSRSWELRTIRDVLRNSRRYDLEVNIVYTALYTQAEVPGLTPAEAMIIAEREWITGRNNHIELDI